MKITISKSEYNKIAKIVPAILVKLDTEEDQESSDEEEEEENEEEEEE